VKPQGPNRRLHRVKSTERGGEYIAIRNEKHTMHILFSPVLANVIWIGGGSVGVLIVIVILVLLFRWAESRARSKKTFAATLAANHQETSSYTMTKLEIKGDWNITKGKLKQKWASLSDDDLTYAEGKQEELFGRIQKRTGETREAIEKAIKESSSACGCS